MGIVSTPSSTMIQVKVAEDMESSVGEVVGAVGAVVALLIAVMLVVLAILVSWKRKGKCHTNVPIDNPIYSGVMQRVCSIIW